MNGQPVNDSRQKLRAVFLTLLMVVSVFAGTVALSGVAASQAANQTVGDAQPGTIFQDVIRNGATNDTNETVENVGLVKRGRSGEFVYNPNLNIDLVVGDVLVARNGDEFVVTVNQSLDESSGFVGPGATVFAGEQNTRFVGFADDTLIGEEEQGAEGRTLDLNQTIPGDQAEGVYRDSEDNRITVDVPEFRNLEVVNQNGRRVDPGQSIEENNFLIAKVDANYLEAERAEVGVYTQAGTYILSGLISREEALERLEARDLSTDFVERIPEGKAQPSEATGLADRGIANPNTDRRDTVWFIYDLSEIDKPATYQVLVNAENDEPSGDVYQDPGVFTGFDWVLKAEDNPRLRYLATEAGRNVTNDTVVRGEFLTYRVERITHGNNNVISIAANDLRTRPDGETNVDDITRDVFRAVDDAGFTNGVLLEQPQTVNGVSNVIAVLNDGRVVQDDGTIVQGTSSDPSVDGDSITELFTLTSVDAGDIADGQIDTGALDDTSVDINVFDEFGSQEAAVSDYAVNRGTDEVDERTLDVREGDETLAIESPGQTYIAGDDVDVIGRASPAFDRVAVYARDEGDWELVDELDDIAVDGEGRWDELNKDLSELSKILSVPGTFRIGVIAREDADLDNDGQPDQTMETSEFSQGSSDQRTIRVVNQTLDGVIHTYGGQVAEEDGIVNVTGEARGAEDVFIVFIDDKGNIGVTTETVDNDNTFDNDDVPLLDSESPPSELQEGPMTGLLISAGRDDVFGEPGGEGGSGFADAGAFANFLRGLQDQSLTRSQAVELIRERTVDDDGSDDLVVSQDFIFTDANTRIDAIAPAASPNQTEVPIVAGEEVLVRGRTNLKPDDNDIVFELSRTPDGFNRTAATLPIIDTWKGDGLWRFTFTLPDDAPAGTYEVEADDGETISTLEFEVVSELTASVAVSNQQSSEGRTVFVEEAALPRGGYVRLHSGSAEGPVLGTSDYVGPGSQSVRVTLDESLQESATVVAVAHQGTQDQVGDQYTADGNPVSDSAEVTVPAEPTPTPTPTPEEPTPTPTPTEEPTPTPTPSPTQGQPGFGFTIAVIAIVGAALIVMIWRRL